MSEIRVKALKPLPEPLPEGERVLWQHSPAWKTYSRRVFHVDKFALYFLIIIAWVAISAFINSGEIAAVLRSLVWSVPAALGALVLLTLFAWMYARTSVYTITNKRVVIQSGLAFETSVNLPFSKIVSADMKTYKDGSGNIELTLSGPRLLYSMLWPNVRFLKLNRPTPMLRALENPKQVADILGQALAADQTAETEPEQGSDELASDIHGTATS